MHTCYKITVRNTDGRIVRVDDFTRYTEITTFHVNDLALATTICAELTAALAKRGILCPTNK